MAIALVQVQHGGTSGSVITPDTTILTPTGAGNLLVVMVMQSGSTSITGVTDNAGNTYVSAGARSSVVGTGTSDIWYCKNCLPGATLATVSYSANTGSNTDIYEFSGVNTTAPLSTVNTSSNATPGLGAAITPVTTGELLLGEAVPNAVNLTGVSSPWTGVGTVNVGDGGQSGYYINPPVSSQQIPFTPNSNQILAASTVSFLAAPVISASTSQMFLVF